MISILLEIVKQLNSSVFVLISILVCVFIVLYKSGRWTEKFKHHEEKIAKAESFSERIIELKTKVDLIYENTNPRRTVAAMSPISLTDIGNQIAEKIEANRLLQKYVGKLSAEVELENPKNAYDIQMSSMRIAKEKMLSFLDENELNIVKQEAYSRGVIVQDVMAVFGVLLRNYILNQKNIPIAAVDTHAPQGNR
jgi:vesicle coat complex subunit